MEGAHFIPGIVSLFQDVELCAPDDRIYCHLPFDVYLTHYMILISVMGIVQLEVSEQVMGYSEYDLRKNKHVDTVTLKYPPSVIKTVGLVSSTDEFFSVLKSWKLFLKRGLCRPYFCREGIQTVELSFIRLMEFSTSYVAMLRCRYSNYPVK